MIHFLETNDGIILLGQVGDACLVTTDKRRYQGDTILYCEEGAINLLTVNNISKTPKKGKVLHLYKKGELVYGSSVINKIAVK